MSSTRYTASISGGGLSISANKTRESDGAEGLDPTLPVGKAGTLTTRTDDNTGEATLGSGHGVTDGMIVDVYWAGGSRYGMTVGTVAALVVPIDGGAGDNLPSASTPLVVTPQVQITLALDGDLLVLFGIKAEFVLPTSTARAQATFHDAAADVIAHLDLNANQLVVIDVEGGDTNPFTGDPITYIKASNGSSSEVCTLKIVRAQDATP